MRIRFPIRTVWIMGPLTIVVMTVVATTGARAVATPGSQGTNTALPPTDSQVTVSGRGEFANVSFNVNQTKDLTTQALSITWTGATPTVIGPGRFGQQYMQIMQCWGDDDGTVPDNPGPPPEQCEQGAVAQSPALPPAGVYPNQLALTRIAIDQKQRVHARDHLHSLSVLRIQFHRVDELAPRVRPASHVRQLRPADILVCRIPVGLQNPFPFPEKLARTLPAPAQTEVEHRLTARLSVLPQIRLMVFTTTIVHLHRNRRFIRL